ncbi:hypothetical protein AB0912_21745 [Streptomyces sp. NPDC007084]|uniref:hypothetical protein n=1 Tax=Streptomyces sp. NPDC007084 TaxID=3154313 RepID=UPI00345527D4
MDHIARLRLFLAAGLALAVLGLARLSAGAGPGLLLAGAALAAWEALGLRLARGRWGARDRP